MLLSFKKKHVFCLFFLLFSVTIFAQNETKRQIRGTLADSATGSPLIGATVQVKSKNSISTITDKSGFYSIDVSSKEVLVFSYVGYVTVEVPVLSSPDILNLKMQLSGKGMDEVIIIGYGNVKRADLTGAVGKVDMKDLAKAPVISFEEALAGRIAGVSVNSSDGQPGSEMNIVIRGGNSVTQSNAPLYVIDGFPIEDFSAASLNTDDIESITVLKDASATAIYGSRGANGVIIIETKKGKVGRTEVSYNAFYGKQYITRTIPMMNPYEFVKYQLELDPARTTDMYITTPGLTLDDYKTAKNIDWQSLMFRPATFHNHTLSLRGGNSSTQYSVSGNYTNQDGIVINSGYSRSQTRMGLVQRINDKLKASVNLNYAKDKNFGNPSAVQQSSANSYASYLMYRIWGYRPVSNGADIVNDLFDEEDNNALFLMNPVISTMNEIRQQTNSNLLVNADVSYEVAPSLTLNVRGGYNSRFTKNEAFYNSKTYRGYPSTVNLLGVNGNYSDVNLQNWVNENTLTFNKRLNKDQVLNVVAGATVQGTRVERYGFVTSNIPFEDLGLRSLELGIPSSTTSTASRNTLLSFLGRVNYKIFSKYLFTAALRADGSSKFSKENRWGLFPSGAFAWQIGNEKFVKRIKAITDAKLRVSYGITGNNRIGDFSRLQTIDISEFYSFGNQTPSNGTVISGMGNQDLKWERTGQLDLGLDVSLFEGRINLVVDAYRKTTSDLLLDANIPLSTGFTTVFKNVGKVRNDGLEFTLSSVNVKSKDFTWESSLNISFNRNKILALNDDQQNILSIMRFTGSYNSIPLYIAQLGGPVASFYGYIWDGNYQYEDFDQLSNGTYVLKQSVPTNGNSASVIQPGDIKYVDVNGDGVVNTKDMVTIGNPLPKHFGGFSNNLSYKGFGLNIFFQWSYGNDVMNANRIQFEGNMASRPNLNQFATYANRWTPENQTNEMPRARGFGPLGMYSTRTIEDGSFLRLKTAQLSYTFSKTQIKKIESLQVYVSAQNIFTITNYQGFDPEVSTRSTNLTPGFDYSAYPRALTTTAGIKIIF